MMIAATLHEAQKKITKDFFFRILRNNVIIYGDDLALDRITRRYKVWLRFHTALLMVLLSLCR